MGNFYKKLLNINELISTRPFPQFAKHFFQIVSGKNTQQNIFVCGAEQMPYQPHKTPSYMCAQVQ